GANCPQVNAVEVQRIQCDVVVSQLRDLRKCGADHGLVISAKELAQQPGVKPRAPGKTQPRLEIVLVAPAGRDDAIRLETPVAKAAVDRYAAALEGAGLIV